VSRIAGTYRRSLLLIFGFLCSLGSDTSVSLIDSSQSERVVSSETFHSLGDWFGLASLANSWEREDTLSNILVILGLDVLQLLRCGIIDKALLGNTSMSWEQEEFGLVLGDSCDIGSLIVSVLVMSSVINCNSNRLSECWSKTCLSDFRKGETSAMLKLGTIFKSLSMNQRSKLAYWHWSQCFCPCCSLGLSNFLMSLLVEEALDSSHPMFSQVRTLKYIIVFYHVAY